MRSIDLVYLTYYLFIENCKIHWNWPNCLQLIGANKNFIFFACFRFFWCVCVCVWNHPPIKKRKKVSGEKVRLRYQSVCVSGTRRHRRRLCELRQKGRKEDRDNEGKRMRSIRRQDWDESCVCSIVSLLLSPSQHPAGPLPNYPSAVRSLSFWRIQQLDWILFGVAANVWI